MFDPLLILELGTLGIFTGFLAGVLGIGGGMVAVPFMTLVLSHRGIEPDLCVKMAIATSMATIIFTSFSNVYAQQKRGAIRWDLFKNIAPGIVLGGLITSIGIFSFLKGQWLAIFFGLFVSYSATKMLITKKSEASKGLPHPLYQAGMGIFIGALSGLVGAGGGFISVPYLTNRGIPMHNAIATSAALGMPIAIFNTLGCIYSGWNLENLPAGALGYIYLPALLIVATASSLMAPVGVRVSHSLPIATLKRLFAFLLYALAAYMLYKGLTS